MIAISMLVDFPLSMSYQIVVIHHSIDGQMAISLPVFFDLVSLVPLSPQILVRAFQITPEVVHVSRRVS